MLYNLPEDIQQKIWRDVFQHSLNELRWNGMEHIRKCGLCKQFLLKDENLLPITESYEILTEFYGLPVRSYHCKCQFHDGCVRAFYDENRDLPINMRPECNICKKCLLPIAMYIGMDSDSDEDSPEDSDEDSDENSDDSEA